MAEKKVIAEISRDFRLLGFATPIKEYRLCFHLNNLLGCDFVKEKDIEIEYKDRTRQILFSVFRSGAVEGVNQFFVFNNKNLGDYLLPELAKFDFLLQIKGKYDDESMKLLLEKLKSIPQVMLASEIQVKKIKNYDRLHFEIESTTPKLLKFPKNKLS